MFRVPLCSTPTAPHLSSPTLFLSCNVFLLGEALAYALFFGIRIRHEHSDSRLHGPSTTAPVYDSRKPDLSQKLSSGVFWKRKNPERPKPSRAGRKSLI